MKRQMQRDNIKDKSELIFLYKNIDLEKLLKTYEENLQDLRRCL